MVGRGVSVGTGRVGVSVSVPVGGSGVSVGVNGMGVSVSITDVDEGMVVSVVKKGVLVGTEGTYKLWPEWMTVLVRQLAFCNCDTVMRNIRLMP